MSPTITPGYWQCPRCNSTDHYFAPRVVGQVGVANPMQIGENEFAGGIARSVEKDVALCRSCGERAKWIPEVRTYSAEESKTRLKNWCIFLAIISTAYFFFTVKMAEFGWEFLHVAMAAGSAIVFIWSVATLLKNSKSKT
jgi:hypothetical protein